MPNLLYANQYFTAQLNVGGGINNTQTTGIVIDDVSGIDITKPGIALLNFSSPLNTSLCEWIEYSSIDGSNELQGVVRGVEGFGAKSHANGVTVAFPLSESHINRLADALSIGGSPTNGVSKTIETVNQSSNLNTELITASYVGNQTSITSSATPTPTGDRKHNELYITALAVAANFQAPSGTPTNGNTLTIRVKDNGTARALTWNAIFNPRYATLPTTTTVNKYLHIEFVYNSTANTWDCVKSLLENESNSTNIVGVRVLRTSAQSISHNTETAIQYTSETFDTHNFHDNTTNNTRMTVPSGKGGLYLLTANANFAASSTGRRTLLFRKNGSTTFAQVEWGNSSSNIPYMNLSSMIDMVAGDYVEVFVFQTSGGNLNIDTYLNASFIRLGGIPS
jgi:hypothetical protein